MFGGMLLIIFIFTAYAWLAFILPLTLWFKDDSNIYLFRFSIPLGMLLSVVALSVYTIVIDVFMRRPSTLSSLFDFPGNGMTFLFPMLFGACTSATLSLFAKSFRKKLNGTPTTPRRVVDESSP